MRHHEPDFMRYHFAKGIPQTVLDSVELLLLTLVVPPTPSEHWLRRVSKKELPRGVPTSWLGGARVIEVSTKRGRLQRVLFRGTWTELNDLCVVVSADGKLVTGWMNRYDDEHELTSEMSRRYMQ